MTRSIRFLLLAVFVTLVATITTQIWAQSTISTPTTPATPAAPAPTTASTAEAVIQQIVEVTRAVPAGTAAVTAYTVPAGSRLVVTDVILTNTGATAVCTLGIARGAQPVTGPVCVPPRASLMLSLTTGLEFAPGETIQLTRPPEAETTAAAATDTISVHMRGFLTAG